MGKDRTLEGILSFLGRRLIGSGPGLTRRVGPGRPGT